MAAPEIRVMVNLPSHGEVMDQIKLEVLRLVGEKVLEFQEERLHFFTCWSSWHLVFWPGSWLPGTGGRFCLVWGPEIVNYNVEATP